MLNEIKPNASGIIFTKDAVLLRYENMSINKKNENDPDYYKVIFDVDGELVNTSAWIGCEIEKLGKDILYKTYKVTFACVKNTGFSKNGNSFEYYKVKVIGIQKTTLSI